MAIAKDIAVVLRSMRIPVYAFVFVASATAPAKILAQSEDTPLHRALGAPDDLTITASIRPRIEAIDGQFRPDAAARDQLLSIRTTLAIDYHPGPFFVGGEIWDVRGYLERDRSSTRTGEVNALEPIQAYAGYQLGDALGRDTTSRVTAGRFTQDLGARRFVARQRFRNTTNSFTGVKLDWSNKRGDEALFFWTMPQNRLPDTPARVQRNAVVLDHEGTDLQFFGGSFTRSGVLGGSLQVYAFGLTERDTPRFATTNRHLFTPGIRLTRKPGKATADYEIEATYQTGRARASDDADDRTNLDVSAYFFHFESGYTFAAGWSPRLVLQYDLASGDSGQAGKLGRFDTLFGARREYGPTDLYGLFQRSNISSPAIRLELEPSNRTESFISYRAGFLSRAQDSFADTGVQDETGRAGKFAGHQFEGGVTHDLIPNRVKLTAGAVYLAKGRFLTLAPNAPATGDTLYGFTDVTFSF